MIVEVGAMPAARVDSSAPEAWPVCPACQTGTGPSRRRRGSTTIRAQMASGRAERAFLSILCGVAVVTASPRIAAASAPAGAPIATETPAGPASTRVFSGATEVPTQTSSVGADAGTVARDPKTQPTTQPTTQEETSAPAEPEVPAPAPVGDDTTADDVPERLTPMQAVGWWTLFGGVAVGTLAGVMAGLAERQEDRALRLSVRFDLATGAQTRYEDVEGEYESALRRGRAQANAGIGLAVVGLAAVVAGVAVLGVASARARRDRAPRSNARLHWRGSGMQVKF